ncbi:MAG: FAD-dependent monooxygenase [Bacteroidetes bacterium]|nr:FAD-dependent monooxygenase [Bacteroidota bacterium]
MTKQHTKITIVGAGLAGSVLAVYFAKRGLSVDVYEHRPDMRQSSTTAGRSINLALSKRGIHALREVGLLDAIMDMAIPMRGRLIHATDGTLTFQRYGKDDSEVIYSVSRGELNRKLIDLAEAHSNVRLHFQMRCDGIDTTKHQLRVTDERTGKSHSISGQPVVATDGAGSAVRTSMEQHGLVKVSSELLEHGYKELTIPASEAGGFALDPHALHIWPRKSFMLIALPNPDASFTCTLFLRHEGTPGFSSLNTADSIRSFFDSEFPDASALMPTLEKDFLTNPVGILGTIRCFPWHLDGSIALLGDACHAIVPFFGQGMNCAFEDCTVLNDCLDEYGYDWTRIFRIWEKRRKVNADAIADLALENFVEMRDHVADPQFLLTKQIGLELERRFPEYFIPKYSMVTFHRTPYAVALRRGIIQTDILRTLAVGISSAEQVDYALAGRLLRERLRPYSGEAVPEHEATADPPNPPSRTPR